MANQPRKKSHKSAVIASGKAKWYTGKNALVGVLVLALIVGIGWFGFNLYRQNSANAASCNTQPFKDVAVNSPFCGEIQWLKDKGVTSGYSDGTFHPSETMSREEMALTMYRYARLSNTSLPVMPAACTASPYPDVPVSSAYCGAIAWMKTNGITTGYEDGTYRPSGTAGQLNRDAAAAFMYRIARLSNSSMPAKPTCTTQPFTDVPTNYMFCGEIQWVKNKGITTGYSDGTFHPTSPISHEAVAAFLYRAAGSPTTVPNPTTPTPSTPDPTPPVTPPATTPPVTTSAKATKLLVIMDENHSPNEVYQSMPYAVSQAKAYGEATSLYAYHVSSNTDYLAFAGGIAACPGSTYIDGALCNNNPPSSSKQVSGSTVFGQALKLGKTAKVYAEGMTSNCMVTNTGKYAVKHNPWPYFVDERTDCQKFNVSTDSFAADVQSGNLPNAGLLVPDMCNDAHDCSLSVADTWLKARMQEIYNGPDWKSGNLIVIFTFDEPNDGGDQGVVNNTPVFTFIAHPSLKGKSVSTRLDLYSITRLYAEVLGTTPLGKGVGAASIRDAFGLPL